jgi:transcriptional regulator with XRE-family HTH domain
MTPTEIRDFRKRLDMSQREFAKAVGVTQPAVQGWEKGRSDPPESTKELIKRWRENIDASGAQDWQRFLIAAGGVGLGVKVIFDYINSRDS